MGQVFDHFLFEIIRPNSSTTPLEGPNIFRIFFDADFSRYTETREINKRQNLQSQPLGYILKTSINVA